MIQRLFNGKRAVWALFLTISSLFFAAQPLACAEAEHCFDLSKCGNLAANGGSDGGTGGGAVGDAGPGGGDATAVDGCVSAIGATCSLDIEVCGDNTCHCGRWIPAKLAPFVQCDTPDSGSPDSGGSDGGSDGGTTECNPGVNLVDCTTSCGSTGHKGCQQNGTWSPCVPPTEVCGNSVDDNCDGKVDEDCGKPACTPGQTSAGCGTACGSIGASICGANGQWGTCDPPPEACGNSVDDNCNNLVDEGCVPNPPGTVDVTYRFTLPPGFSTADTITIFDMALDSAGSALPRSVPFGATDFDTHYVWGTATDTTGTGCYASSTTKIECIVHRPLGSEVDSNTQFRIGNATFWSCANGNGTTIGTFEVYVAGQPKAYTKKSWPQEGGKPPLCLYDFKL